MTESPQWSMASSFTRFLDHKQRRATVGRTSLDERPARRTDLHLTTHNTQYKHSCPRWDSNPQSQQASGRRITPHTVRPLGPADVIRTKQRNEVGTCSTHEKRKKYYSRKTWSVPEERGIFCPKMWLPPSHKAIYFAGLVNYFLYLLLRGFIL